MRDLAALQAEEIEVRGPGVEVKYDSDGRLCVYYHRLVNKSGFFSDTFIAPGTIVQVGSKFDVRPVSSGVCLVSVTPLSACPVPFSPLFLSFI